MAKLSKRERNIFIGVIAVLGIWAADQYAFTPYVNRRNAIEAESAKVLDEMQHARRLFNQRKENNRRWSQAMAPGLKSEQTAASGQLLHALREWAQDSGLNLSLVNPEAPVVDKQFGRLMVRAQGTGSLSSIARFLFRIETAGIPARAVDVTITARKEGVDDLALTLGISTLYTPPPTTTAPAGGTASAKAPSAVKEGT